MTHIAQFCAENPVLMVFAVIALGYPLGRISVGPISLGVAGVLFAGLGVGALVPEIKPPEALHVLGLSLFVYAIGLSSGPSFLTTLKSGGMKANLVSLLGLAAATLTAAVSGIWLGKAQAAGLFAGALTNTPALAGVGETRFPMPPTWPCANWDWRSFWPASVCGPAAAWVRSPWSRLPDLPAARYWSP